MESEHNTYGVGDSSYKAAGELAGLTRLVDAFYDFMDSLPEVGKIREMHPVDLTESRKKLVYFLSGWLGGPRIYAQTFGQMSIPQAHQHLPLTQIESDMWILCMQKAVDEQPYAQSFKVYLIRQLRVPAQRIRAVCEASQYS